MSLLLDSRQRAMLQEMGVRVWSPLPEELARSELATQQVLSTPPVQAEARPIDPMPQRVSAPSPQVDEPERFSVLTAEPKAAPMPAVSVQASSWAELKQTVSSCQDCAMCQGRRAPVLLAPSHAAYCDWMVVGEPPDEVQERVGHVFVGEGGQLLDKMLKAVGAQRYPVPGGSAQSDALAQAPASQRAYLTHVLKCRPAQVRAPVASELAICAAHLRREISLVQPKVIVSMGRFAMQLLLSDMPPEQVKLPLGKLRGRVWRYAGVPVVVTYPPDYLLGAPQDKAKAWADLQLAMAVVRGDAVPTA